MKYLIVMMLMIGCNPKDRSNVTVTSNGLELTEICVDGVVYYYNEGRGHGGPMFAPKFSSDDGVVVFCR